MLWITFTIIAVFLQSFRNLEQKSLNKKLDVLTVSWSRFILPLPFSIAVVFLTFADVSNQFILHCVITGTLQVAGNIFLLQALKSRNFSIGIAFYKTEVLQALVIGLIFFNQQISGWGFVMILLTSCGVLLMSNLSFKFSKIDFSQNAAIFGLLTGLCFAITAFHLQIAARDLMAAGFNKISAPTVVLLWVILIQNLLFLVIKSFQGRVILDLKSLFGAENKKSFFKTSLLSFSGSLAWFIAFAIGNVIYIKAIGQLEMILAVLMSQFYLKEKHSKREFFGIAITAVGILLLIFVR